MSTLPQYEVFALRYATVDKTRRENFMSPDPHDNGVMPMDYFVWYIRGPGRGYLVDTGFNEQAARERKRTFLRCPIRALALLGVQPDDVTDVLLTHMHYDHAGNLDLLPRARVHLQEAEIQYTVSHYMAYKPLRHAFCVHDVTHVVHRLFRDELVYHLGDDEIAPGIQLVHVGGHTLGLQSVRVHTARGWVVLASDASHYYENIGHDAPFPIVHDVGQMLDGYRKLLRLAESPEHLIPGHDPLVRSRYPGHGRPEDDIVALHLPPMRT